HLLYAGDRKTLLARAVVTRHQVVGVPTKEGGVAGSVILPDQFELEWVQERLKLSVRLGRPQINPELSVALFEEPKFSGYARKDLRELLGVAGGPSTIRETLPAPPAGGGVRLRPPEPIGPDGASPTRNEPAPLELDLPAATSMAPEPEAV